MSLLEENQATDLEQMVGLTRRRFIGAGALCGAAMFLGGNLLSRSALAVNAANTSPLLGFASIAADTRDTLSLPPGYSASVLISWGQPLHLRTLGLVVGKPVQVQFAPSNVLLGTPL